MKHFLPVGIALFLLIGLLLAGRFAHFQLPKQYTPMVTKVPPAMNAPYATTTLSLSQMPEKTAANAAANTGQYQIPVTITTNESLVNAVEVELKYDKNVLQNVSLSPLETQGFFQSPSVLLKTNDPKEGTIFLSIAEAPGANGKKGKGTVALFSFSVNPEKIGVITQVAFTARTDVTAEGQARSVLKETQGVAFRTK